VKTPRQIIGDLGQLVGLPPRLADAITLTGAEPALPSSFRIGAAAQAAIGATTMAAAEIQARRTGRAQSGSVDMRHAALAYLGINPTKPAVEFEIRLPMAAVSAIADALKDGLVTINHFDAEAFSGACSDVSVFETDDLMAFYFAMERLRDSALFAEPYFEIVQIIPAIPEGFRQFEQLAA